MELATLVPTCEAAAAAAAADWAATILAAEYCHIGDRIPARERGWGEKEEEKGKQEDHQDNPI